MEYLGWLWTFVSDSKYTPFWTAMAPITTLVGFAFIYWQIRYAVKSADVNLIFSLRDRFWSPEMVEVRKLIKSPQSIEWLKQLRNGKILPSSVRVYSPEHIPRFTIFDYFESIGALYRRDRRMLRIIYPIFGADAIFHYRLHEEFYNHEAVRVLYPDQHFRYLAEACIRRSVKRQRSVPTFEDLVANL